MKGRHGAGGDLDNYNFALRYPADQFPALPADRFEPLAQVEWRARKMADGLTRQGANRR